MLPWVFAAAYCNVECTLQTILPSENICIPATHMCMTDSYHIICKRLYAWLCHHCMQCCHMHVHIMWTTEVNIKKLLGVYIHICAAAYRQLPLTVTEQQSCQLVSTFQSGILWSSMFVGWIFQVPLQSRKPFECHAGSVIPEHMCNDCWQVGMLLQTCTGAL